MFHRYIWSYLKAWTRRIWPKQKHFPLPLFPLFYRSSLETPHNASHVQLPLAGDPPAANVAPPNEPKRYALLIGIENLKSNDPTYKKLPGARADIELHEEILRGGEYACIGFRCKDAYNSIEAFGFQDKEIKKMSDQLDEGDPFYPNRANMIRELQELSASLQKGDLGYLAYAGHAKQLPECSGAEIDGLDEALVPADSTGERDTLIIDDELNTLLVAPLRAGATLLVVCDSCHSETILDLPWKYVLREEVKKHDASLNISDAGAQFSTSPIDSPLEIIEAHKTDQGGQGFVLCMSACLDSQAGSEVKNPETGGFNGAATFFLNRLFRNMIGPNGEISNSSEPMTIPSVEDILVRSNKIYQESERVERIQITTSMSLPNPLFSRQDPEAISG